MFIETSKAEKYRALLQEDENKTIICVSCLRMCYTRPTANRSLSGDRSIEQTCAQRCDASAQYGPEHPVSLSVTGVRGGRRCGQVI